jgi:hypothetical protein
VRLFSKNTMVTTAVSSSPMVNPTINSMSENPPVRARAHGGDKRSDERCFMVVL